MGYLPCHFNGRVVIQFRDDGKNIHIVFKPDQTGYQIAFPGRVNDDDETVKWTCPNLDFGSNSHKKNGGHGDGNSPLPALPHP